MWDELGYIIEKNQPMLYVNERIPPTYAMDLSNIIAPGALSNYRAVIHMGFKLPWDFTVHGVLAFPQSELNTHSRSEAVLNQNWTKPTSVLIDNPNKN